MSLTIMLVPRLTGYRWLLVSGASVRIHFGLLSPGVPALVEGDYVLMSWQGKDHNEVSHLKSGLKLVKRVGCLPGHRLRVTDTAAECDGKYIAHMRDRRMDGRPLKPFYFDGMLSNDQVFLIGDHFYSYDSRYFGPVPLGWLRGVVIFGL